MGEKSEYADFPSEKAERISVEEEVEAEEEEFVHEEHQFTWYVIQSTFACCSHI